MLPPSRTARPPNIFFSASPGSSPRISRSRVASPSSYATYAYSHKAGRRPGRRGAAGQEVPGRLPARALGRRGGEAGEPEKRLVDEVALDGDAGRFLVGN